MSGFEQWRAKRGYDGLPGYSQYDFMHEAWNAAIEAAREEVAGVHGEAHEAARAKDATDYLAGYQDATMDVDSALRLLVEPPPSQVPSRDGE